MNRQMATETFPARGLVSEGERQRLRVVVRGAVQGVGFRPFVYRLATELGLPGWVNNAAQGVFIEVEGAHDVLDTFLRRLTRETPPLAAIHSLEASRLDPVGCTAFEIRHSEESGAKVALLLPDIATCPDCLREITDPADRRYRYPFTNCTNCGPRFSIIERLPYDRPHTAMKAFPLCPQCRAEYDNPLDRRFHAQPTACPQCGPHLELWDADGRALAMHHDALLAAAAAIRAGRIVAVKGLGGFHLLVDARADDAVRRLRARKHREEKPFALMFPTLEAARAACEVSEAEARLLRAPESPIVLLRRVGGDVAASVAPEHPHLGVMLPYTPLHHLLLAELGVPVVATSGNLTDEPMCIDEREALVRLRGIADCFLAHNRPIVRQVDDSIVRVMAGRELVLRRARGYAPLPVPVREPLPPLLAVGAHLKNAVAVSVGDQAFVSQHIGDLETVQAHDAFRRISRDLPEMYDVHPLAVACDLHPDYLSTRHAHTSGLPVVTVQHHYAHVLACMADNELAPPVLGVAWDGAGLGEDGTIWGGECFRVDARAYQRVAHLRPFPLPGGDTAAKEPRRAALGLLYAVCGDALFTRTDLPLLDAFTAHERAVLRRMLSRGINVPRTSSMGRLFDAVAALALLRRGVVNYEGQAAMALESALHGVETDEAYPLPLRPAEEAGAPAVVDWAPMVANLRADVHNEAPVGMIAARFHNALAESIVAVARHAGEARVALSGGCFQNRYLTERAVRRLREEGFRPYWHQRIPPNDGGIALGQLLAAARVAQSGDP